MEDLALPHRTLRGPQSHRLVTVVSLSLSMLKGNKQSQNAVCLGPVYFEVLSDNCCHYHH